MLADWAGIRIPHRTIPHYLASRGLSRLSYALPGMQNVQKQLPKKYISCNIEVDD